MANLIDRDELKKRYSTTAQSGGYLGDAMSIATNHLTRLLRLIDEAPTVELKPKKGEWIDFNPSDPLDPRMKCSCCGDVLFPKTTWIFCPHCGADMRGESDENNC